MKEKAFKVFSVALGIVAFGFFLSTLFSSWNDLQAATFVPQAAWAVPVVLLTVATILSGFLWKHVVKVFTGVIAPPRETLAVHFVAWIMRYLPTVGSVTYKSLWLASRGIRFRLASIPIIFEGFYVQITSFAVGFTLLFPAMLTSGESLIVLWLSVSLILLILSAFFFNSALAGRLLRLSQEEVRLGATTPPIQLLLFCNYLLPRLITASAASLLGVAVAGANIPDALALGGAFLISAALGFLVPFVPSGLGIREGVLVGLLVFLGWTTATAVTISILLRFLTTLSDLAIAGVWVAVRPKKHKKESGAGS